MSLSPTSRESLRSARDAVCARHGFAVAAASFAAAAEAHARGRLVRLGLEPTAERLAEALDRMCLEDLCLAHACDRGDEPAWAALHRTFSPRLLGLARTRGLEAEGADAAVTSLLADLAVPPGGAGASTLIGTYRGTGSLFGWLAVILTRRIARAAGGRRMVSLEAADAAPIERAASPAQDPARPLVDAELAEALRVSLQEGWSACTPREQLAVVLKHRDGRPHREIAAILGVGVPRVSQLLQQGLARLATAVRRRVPEGLDEAARAVARQATEYTLATFQPPVPPAGDGHTTGGDA